MTYWRIEEYIPRGTDNTWRVFRDSEEKPLEFTNDTECAGAMITLQKAFPSKRFRITTSKQRVGDRKRRPRKRYIPEALRDQYPQ